MSAPRGARQLLVLAMTVVVVVSGILLRAQSIQYEHRERSRAAQWRLTAVPPPGADQRGLLLNRVVPKPGAPVLTLTTDPSCPACQRNWEEHGDQLRRLAARDDVEVRLQVVSRVATDRARECVASFYSQARPASDLAALYGRLSKQRCSQTTLPGPQWDWVNAHTFDEVGLEHHVPRIRVGGQDMESWNDVERWLDEHHVG